MTDGEGDVASRQPERDRSGLERLPDNVAATERLDRSIRRMRHSTQQTDYTFAVLVLALDRNELITDMLGSDGRDRAHRPGERAAPGRAAPR